MSYRKLTPEIIELACDVLANGETDEKQFNRFKDLQSALTNLISTYPNEFQAAVDAAMEFVNSNMLDEE